MTDPKDTDLLTPYAKGATIYEQGAAGEDMYIVASGTVRMVRRLGAAERELGVIEKGDFFGEMSLLEGTPRRATAVAGADCQLLPIDSATFAGILRQEPELLIRMLRKLSRRLYQHEAAQDRADEIAASPFSTGTGKSVAGAAKASPPPAPPAADEAAPPAPPPAPPAAPASEAETAPAPAPASAKESAAPKEAAPAAKDTSEKKVPTKKEPNGALLHQETGTRFVVEREKPAVIGRFDSATGRSPEVDLTEIDSGRSLSRRHARVHWKDGCFHLREEPGVSNGTFLGTERLAAETDYALENGARIRCGVVDLLFELE